MIIIKRIESPSNELIKNVKKLKNKSERYKQRKFIAEGKNLCYELLNNRPENISEIFMADGFYDERFEQFNCYSVSERVLESLCEVITPQGVAAVVDMDTPESIKNYPDLVLYLDDVKDPGNMGTLIRTADAAGIGLVVLSPQCVDIYNSKTVRSTMGSIFHINIYSENEYLSEINKLKKLDYNITAGCLDAKKSIYQADFTKKTVICLGNEAHGISYKLSELVNESVIIPIPGKAESLNVSVAGGILMYEALRQRNEYNE